MNCRLRSEEMFYWRSNWGKFELNKEQLQANQVNVLLFSHNSQIPNITYHDIPPVHIGPLIDIFLADIQFILFLSIKISHSCTKHTRALHCRNCCWSEGNIKGPRECCKPEPGCQFGINRGPVCRSCYRGRITHNVSSLHICIL